MSYDTKLDRETLSASRQLYSPNS